MKLQEEKKKVQLSEGMETRAFRIKASPQAFRRLAADYSDIILAVIRELSTNAADAMTAAGKKNQKFLVHLPNSFEPYFSVKDNGVGMDDETIFNLYTTFFDSDKIFTDEQTGCLGLGSKSPFAYTDSFTVTSRYNGKQTTYSCFVHEDGCPHITKHNPVDTDECNGFEVNLAVEEKDFKVFCDKAQQAYQWFESPPEVIGNKAYKLPSHKYLYQGERYGVPKSRPDNRSYVIMGNVAYNIDQYSVRDFNARTNSLREELLRYGVHLFAPMGAVDFLNNRENLQYTEKTKKFINEVLEEIIEFLRNELLEEIAKSKTRWEARSILANHRHPILGNLYNNGWSPRWNGEVINTDFQFPTLGMDTPLVEEMYWDSNKFGYDKYRTKQISAAKSDKIEFFICDLNVGNYSQIARYMSEKYGIGWRSNGSDIDKHTAVAINPKVKHHQKQNPSTGRWVSVPYSENENFPVEKVLDEEGIKYTYVSKLPKPVKDKSPKINYEKTAKINVFKKIAGSPKSSAIEFWEPTDIDPKKGGVYVRIQHFYWFFGEPNKNVKDCEKVFPRELSTVKDFILQPFDLNVPIYGIRPSDMKVISKHKDVWIDLYDYIKQIKEDNIDLYSKLKFVEHCRNRTKWLFTMVKSGEFTHGSILDKYARLSKFYHQWAEDPKIVAYRKVVSYFDKTWFKNIKNNFLQKLETVIFKENPLLTKLYYYGKLSEEDTNSVINYLESVDFAKNNGKGMKG